MTEKRKVIFGRMRRGKNSPEIEVVVGKKSLPHVGMRHLSDLSGMSIPRMRIPGI